MCKIFKNAVYQIRYIDRYVPYIPYRHLKFLTKLFKPTFWNKAVPNINLYWKSIFSFNILCLSKHIYLMSRIFNYVHILEFCVQPLTRFLLIRSFHGKMVNSECFLIYMQKNSKYNFSLLSVNGQFQWKDPLSIERLLSDEERSIRDVARKYAKDNLMPRVVQCFRHESMNLF